MKLPKNMFVVVGGAVFVVLAGLSGFLLFRGFSQLAQSERTLTERRNRLAQFYGRNPFPSLENVGRERENSQKINALFERLLTSLSKDQVKPAEKSPSTFMSVLSAKHNALLAMAKRSGTVLTPETGMGFARYLAADSTLPAPDDVPRLTHQLMIVERLGEILFSEKVAEVVSVKREEFETAAPSGRPPTVMRSQEESARLAKAGMMEPQKLYTTFRFTLEFKAGEKALIGILNRLATDRTFMVVRRLEIIKEQPDVSEFDVPAGRSEDEADKKQEQPRNMTRQQRMVSGQVLEKPMKVSMELDIYRFRQSE